MKIENSDGTITHGNTGEGRVTKMGISQKAMKHIAKVLTTLYNDPESAVFREVVANGIDAHTKAGISKAVHVFLPTRNTPVFTVIDFGVGMSTEKMEQVFCQYGESDKADSDEEIGGFGLGSKSPLAIASQFTVISVKDGIRTHAIISNSEDGQPEMEVVDIRETDQPNGTSVAIPISNYMSFNQKANGYFKYFTKGSVSLGGEVIPKHYTDEHKDEFLSLTEIPELGTTIRTFKTGPHYQTNALTKGMLLVMGGVRYIVPTADIRSNLTVDEESVSLFDELLETHTVIEAPIGAVKLSPAREGIQFTKKTRAYFNQVFSTSAEGLRTTLIKKITDAKTYAEAVENYSELSEGRRKIVPNTWEGVRMLPSQTLNFNGNADTIQYSKVNDRSDYSTSSSVRLSIPNILFVTGKAKSKTLARYIPYYMRARAAEGEIPFIYYVGEALELSVTPRKEEKDLTDDDGFVTKEFTALTEDQLAVVFPDGIPLTTFEELRTISNKYRKDNLAPVSKASKELVETRYPILDIEKSRFRFEILSELDFNDYEKVLYIEDLTRKAGAPGTDFFNEAIECSNNYVNVDVPEYLMDLITGSYGTDALIIGLSSGRKPIPLQKGLKLLDQEPAEKLDYSPLYKQIAKTTKIKESDVLHYMILGNSDVLRTLAKREVAVKDPALRKLFNYDSYRETGKTIEKLKLVSRNTELPKSVSPLVKDIIRAVGTWGSLKNCQVAPKSTEASVSIHRKYPLLSSINEYRFSGTSVDHMATYLDTVHRTNKAKAFTL